MKLAVNALFALAAVVVSTTAAVVDTAKVVDVSAIKTVTNVDGAACWLICGDKSLECPPGTILRELRDGCFTCCVEFV